MHSARCHAEVTACNGGLGGKLHVRSDTLLRTLDLFPNGDDVRRVAEATDSSFVLGFGFGLGKRGPGYALPPTQVR